MYVKPFVFCLLAPTIKFGHARCMRLMLFPSVEVRVEGGCDKPCTGAVIRSVCAKCNVMERKRERTMNNRYIYSIEETKLQRSGGSVLVWERFHCGVCKRQSSAPARAGPGANVRIGTNVPTLVFWIVLDRKEKFMVLLIPTVNHMLHIVGCY